MKPKGFEILDLMINSKPEEQNINDLCFAVSSDIFIAINQITEYKSIPIYEQKYFKPDYAYLCSHKWYLEAMQNIFIES